MIAELVGDKRQQGPPIVGLCLFCSRNDECSQFLSGRRCQAFGASTIGLQFEGLLWREVESD